MWLFIITVSTKVFPLLKHSANPQGKGICNLPVLHVPIITVKNLLMVTSGVRLVQFKLRVNHIQLSNNNLAKSTVTYQCEKLYHDLTFLTK